MKRILAISAAMLISGSAFAAENANCFGQARAADASRRTDTIENWPGNPKNEGQILSQRKGDNAEQNAAFKEACQNAPS